MKCPEVDWSSWVPTEVATLLFVVPGDGRVLLIDKKRGHGRGLINAPGGHLEPGESALECAVREVREELCIEVQDPREAGLLRFHFMDGMRMQGHVFKGTRYSGTPTETDEAAPLWFEISKIPYHRMWQDDPLWVPLMLHDIQFDGRFVFDGERMLWHDVKPIGTHES
jgi:8-oxo-dGTP diphosphatase